MDTVSPQQRSMMMGRVKGKDTKPEMKVRQALHAAGFRFRLHDKRLPGRPDLVFPRYRTAAFVHGCFWHGHNCRKGLKRPSSNVEFWNEKLDRNIARDRANVDALKNDGWDVLVVWECDLEAGIDVLAERLRARRALMNVDV